jgi:hypothetical protein
MTIASKPPSSKFFKLLDKVVEHQTTRLEYDIKSQEHQTKSRELFVEAIEVAREDGLSDFEISTFTRDYLKKKIPETSLRRYLEELKPIEESSTQNPPNPELEENDDNNDTEQEEAEIVVTTDGSQTTNFEEEQDEEPSELDLLKIKNAQLEDALKKTEQFKPATALQDEVNTVTLRAGIGGIENMIRLEIPKLKNRGWKTVEITMRAV